MFKITVEKINEAEGQNVYRKFDDGCQDEVFEEAIIEMIDQLKDNRTMEDIIKKEKYELPGHKEVVEKLNNLFK